MSSILEPSGFRRFPNLKDDIGEDPARYLDQDLTTGRELIEARIRGIDYLATVRAWMAVERHLGRGLGGRPRPEVIDLLQEREAVLEAEGDRDDRIDPDTIRRRKQRQLTQFQKEAELEASRTSYQHEGCEGTVERQGELAYHCDACDHAVPRAEVLEVVEAEGVEP